MNPILQRQLRRHLPEGVPVEMLGPLLEVVSRTYDELEGDARFLSHTLEVTSQELTEANARIRSELEGRVNRISDQFERTLDLQPNLIFRCQHGAAGYSISLARGELLRRLGFAHEEVEHHPLAVLFPREAERALFDKARAGAAQVFDAALGKTRTLCQVSVHPHDDGAGGGELIGCIEAVSVQRQVEARLRETSAALSERAHELEQHRRVMLSMIEDLDLSRTNITRERDRANALADELRVARDVAEAANSAKSEFLASMSHEIRTPLHGIVSAAELLAGGALDQRQGRLVETLQNAAEHLLGLVNDILDFAKIEAGRLDLLEEDFELRNLIGECLALVRPTAERKGLALLPEFALPDPCPVRGDPVRMRQMLVNLLGNAVKFTAAGSVWVRARIEETPEGKQLALEVEDTGVGIDEAQQAKLFQPFTQLESAAMRRHGGTGLGLAISQKIAARLGGRIGVRSQPGKGSVFAISVPYVVGKVLGPRAAVAATRSGERLKVLVVDDTEANLMLMRMLLEDLGHECSTCTSGLAAIDRCVAERPDVVLMDVHMPDLDGVETSRRIMAELRRANSDRVPRIVALTADVRQENRRACFDAGMVGFMTKPVRMRALVEMLGGRGEDSQGVENAVVPFVDHDLAAELFGAHEGGSAQQIGEMVRDLVRSARAELDELGTVAIEGTRERIAARLHRVAGTIVNFAFARAGWDLRRLEARINEVEPDAFRASIGEAREHFETGVRELAARYPALLTGS